MNQEERIWLLISRAVSGAITPEEHSELEQIFLLEPELRADHENLKSLRVNVPAVHSVEERRAMDRGLQRFNLLLANEGGYAEKPIFENSTIKPIHHTRRKNWLAAASIISLLTIGALGFYYKKGSKPETQQALSTVYGKRIHTTLPDGSKVWLNAGSSITYAYNSRGNGKREITLNGEAYFDVKHDNARPFIVHAGKLDVIVLGTAFNVKAYATDKFMETTLIRGKVAISGDGSASEAIVLYPNEKVTISTGKFEARKSLVSTRRVEKDSLADVPRKIADVPIVPEDVAETGWLNDRLTFKKENFTDLANQMERWYAVTIVFDNGKFLTKQFTGAFKGQDINEVMHALQLIQPFNYKITNNQIHIW